MTALAALAVGASVPASNKETKTKATKEKLAKGPKKKTDTETGKKQERATSSTRKKQDPIVKLKAMKAMKAMVKRYPVKRPSSATVGALAKKSAKA